MEVRPSRSPPVGVDPRAGRAAAPADVGVNGQARGAPIPAAGAPARIDPFDAVLQLGGRQARIGVIIACIIAFGSHGAISIRAVTALIDMMRAVQVIRAAAHEFFWSHYDIEVERTPPAAKPEQPPPPPPEPPPPEPVRDATPKTKVDPYDSPPPPSQAAKILTRNSSPDDPVDQTDRGIVTGNGEGPSYGMQSASGTGTTPTTNTHAAIGGRPGGTGTGAPQPPPAPALDRSRPAGLSGSTDWGSSCPFPPEADAEQIDRARVQLMVTVRPDGTPQSVTVLSDPGHGFGRAARVCALSHRYTPGLDKTGAPAVTTTPPFTVSFTR